MASVAMRNRQPWSIQGAVTRCPPPSATPNAPAQRSASVSATAAQWWPGSRTSRSPASG
ncbi:hypothetical protein ACFPRL_18475 [Pseudoclavibacter helvolus]